MSVAIERANAEDTDAILALVERLGLPSAGLGDHVATALVARQDGSVVGSAALEMYANGALLRSVAIARRVQGQGLGQRLTAAAIDLASAQGAATVYLLTTTAADFFPRFGFVRITREEVPADVRQSVEFLSACPAGAVVMCKRLDC